MENPGYKCFYCPLYSDFNTVIKHSIDTHSGNPLKCRRPLIHPTKGTFVFQTKDFEVIPKDVINSGKKIIINQERESVTLKAECDYSPLRKQLKENSEKPSSAKQSVSSSFQNSMDEVESIEGTDDLKTVEYEMIRLLPNVISELSDVDKVDGIMNFFKLVNEKRFPLDNIAFDLFLDVVKWFSVSSTTLMRYNPTTKAFWRLGYILFHGRFLRFMSGFKNIGSIINGDSSRGQYCPVDSLINFAVPDARNLKRPNDCNHSYNIASGILVEAVNQIAKHCDDKTYKICFDGKKINCSLNDSGAIDLFGFEGPPTLKERQINFDQEQKLINETKQKIEELLQYGETISSMCTMDKQSVSVQIRSIITVLSNCLKQLREKRVHGENGLTKFKKLGGVSWKTSKYIYVISYLTSRLYEIGECISSLMHSIDLLGNICSQLNSCTQLYARGSEIDLAHQSNFVCLRNHSLDVSDVRDPCFVKQRGEQWMQIRSQARATGSTLHNAIGLNTLKAQLEHFDNVMHKIEKNTVDEITKQKMQYGVDHEIDAVATMVGKVLPVYYPDLTFVEEGCFVLNENGRPLIVVSPDGSGRQNASGKVAVGFEFKCPYPGKTFTTQVHYTLPSYYVLQVLAEMVSLKTDTLLYMCYSSESSTVFEIKFSQHLWSLVWKEINSLYGTANPKRPVKRSNNLHDIRIEISNFVKENVTFIAEVSSVVAIMCSHESMDQPYDGYHFLHNTSDRRSRDDTRGEKLVECLAGAEKSLREAYRLTNTRATEVLVFMVSDLDRLYKPEIPHSVPVAYGLQGRSLTANTMRKMLKFVISECSKKGLYVPVFSSDGQWYNLYVKDSNDRPLTILQLQKVTWNKVKKLKKNELVDKISAVNAINSDLTTFSEQLDMVIENNKSISVWRVKGQNIVRFNSYHAQFLRTDQKIVTEEQDTNKDKSAACSNDALDEILGLLPENIEEKMGSDFTEQLRSLLHISSDQVEKRPESNAENNDVLEGQGIEMEPSSNETNESLASTNSQIEQQSISVISDDHIKAMLKELQTSLPKKWKDISENDFRDMFISAEKINKQFLKKELMVCLKIVQPILKRNNIKSQMSSSKEEMVNLMSEQIGDGSKVKQSSKRVYKRQPVSLKVICKRIVSKYPKQLLNVLYSEYTFQDELKIWQEKNIFDSSVKISGRNEPTFWYSQPEYIPESGTYLFGVLDGHHLLTNARAKCCSTGMPKANICRQAWYKVAKESRTNKSKLNLSMVDDLIDKQSNSFAKRTFSEEVEEEMLLNGDTEEAEFCRLIRHWYMAEDDPGISAINRCIYRLEMRDWLLEKYNYMQFPPPGSHISDIPIVMFEGIITNCERKIQLYSCVKSGCFNSRTISSLDSENFFSDFEKLDPRGTGTIRPEDIPRAIGTALEVIQAKMNPDRYLSRILVKFTCQ